MKNRGNWLSIDSRMHSLMIDLILHKIEVEKRPPL